MADQRSMRRGGFYWLDGQPYPSVTEIIGVLDKPSLRYWFGQQVYRAFAADPGMSEKDALNAPYRKSEQAKARGTAVHSIVEVAKNIEDFEAWLQKQSEIYKGYGMAFLQWMKDAHPTIIEHERTVVSRKFGYAGTLDLLATLNGNGQRIIVDCKTGKDIYSEAFLQLSAYRQALKEEGVDTIGVAVVLLGEDGSYKYQFSEADLFRQFFACKVIWDWQHQDDVAQTVRYAKGNGHAKA